MFLSLPTRDFSLEAVLSTLWSPSIDLDFTENLVINPNDTVFIRRHTEDPEEVMG
jgi:hypothetical protein